MKKFAYYVFTLLISFTLSFAGDNPKPLGLEMGSATISDAKAKYNLKYKGINKYTLGDMYGINSSELNIEGLQDITLIFDKDKKLQAVLMEFPKNFNHTYWRRLYNSLRNKYTLKSSNIPFVGDRYAIFEQGNSIIRLESPHLGFKTYLIYMTKKFRRLYNQKNEEERRNKQRSLENNL
ncbi:MAG: hypothetical protein DSY47_01840 [Hydrogenothermus sp.]|nr:MAG: hypothetical protein DSY47_01840 [Hydrogenothermus sp.]